MKSGFSQSDILLVDDTPDNLRLLGGLLKECGFRVRSAPSGKLALEAASSRIPDIVLMDINMPEMNGYETCKALKKLEPLRDIPVIFVSALGETVDKVKAFQAGGVDYITKPVKIEEVEARVKTHLTIRHLQIELQDSLNELKKLEAHRDQLTHMVAHDMRSPLGVILGCLDLFTQCYGSELSEDALELIQSPLVAANSLNRMVDEMLDVSRLDSDKMPLNIEPVTVADLVTRVGELVSLDGRSLILDLDQGAESVACDLNLMVRVLANLVNNAVKYSPPEGEIRLVTHSTSGMVRFQVIDQGPGISQEYHQKIFEKFGQVDGEQTPKASSGLGLTFCQLAVEAHEGEIGVESRRGGGSCFWFTIPESVQKKMAA